METGELAPNATFFETDGWKADNRIYSGELNPKGGGNNRASKGEFMIKWEGDADENRIKCSCSLKLLN